MLNDILQRQVSAIVMLTRLSHIFMCGELLTLSEYETHGEGSSVPVFLYPHN